MKTKKTRVFIPSKVNTTVLKWIYKNGQLTCLYEDGLKCKSDYTLKELLSIEKPKELQEV